MIKRIENVPNVKMNKPVKRDSTFSEVLRHEMAIQIDKVAKQDGTVIYDRDKKQDYKKFMLDMACRHNVSAEGMERITRILERGNK